MYKKKAYSLVETVATCRYCNTPVLYMDTRNSWQKVHTSCAMKNPPDFKYTCGDFTLELRTELLSPNALRKILRKLG